MKPPGEQRPDVATVRAGDRVPVGEKIAYGAGGVAGGLQAGADNGILNPVFVVTCGLSPATMSLAGLIYRVWDAVTDALMGWVTDRTRSPWGRRKPYIAVGAVAMALSMPILFFFDRNWGTDAITLWMIGASLVMFLFLTVWNIPYQCLLYEMTPDSRERTNVAAWRAYFSKTTSLLVSWVWFFTQLPVFSGPDGGVDIINGARWVMMIFAVFVLGLGLLPLLVRQRTFEKGPLPAVRMNLRENLRLTFTSRSFNILVLVALLFAVGAQTKNGLDFYTKLYFVCGGDQKLASTIGGISGTLVTFFGLAGIPLFQWIAARRGKRFALGAVMSVVFFASVSTFVCYHPAYPYWSIAPSVLLAPATTALWVLLPSMVGDVIDEDQLRTGERRDGSFSSVFSWTYKLSLSLSAALSGPLVVAAGFDPKIGAAQPESVLLGMRVLLVLVPALLIGAAIWLIRLYPLDDKRIAANRLALESRRDEATAR